MNTKRRYTIYDPIYNYYKRNGLLKGYDSLLKEHGYKWNSEHRMNNWMVVYTNKLNKKGYTHNELCTEQTGGDNDFLVVDHKKKEYGFWENGFWPFASANGIYPLTHDLSYWAEHRR